VFEGLLSPWHLVILALVLFMVVGPKRFVSRLHHLGRTAQRFVDDDASDDTVGAPAEPGVTQPPTRHTVAYRLGRRFKPRR